MRSDASKGRGGGYGYQSSHGLRRSSIYPSHQPGDKASALKTHDMQQDNSKAPDVFFTGSPGRVLGGGDANYFGSPSAQAAIAAEKRRLQLGEQLSSNSTNLEAPGSTILSSANSSANGPSSGPASIHNNLPIFAAGAFSVQAQMSGGEVPAQSISAGSAYNMSVGELAAQPFFFGLPALSMTQANVGGGNDMDIDMDDDFMMPFPSP